MKGAVIKRMVLDASVAVAWCFEDESDDFTEGVLDTVLLGSRIPNTASRMAPRSKSPELRL